MLITKLQLQNFRCFKEKEFCFNKRVVLIEGGNGSGKTTVLEALHYACYLKSFRSRVSKELIHFEGDHFFVKADFEDDQGFSNEIQIGYKGSEKRVHLNNSPLQSYKNIVSHYRVISTTSDDLSLVSGSPEVRRSFLDHSLFLDRSEYVEQMRNYRQILSNRNNLLFSSHSPNESELKVWTGQLFGATRSIQKGREGYLEQLQKKVRGLIDDHFPDKKEVLDLSFAYVPKQKELYKSDIENFWGAYKESLFAEELKNRRTLFGAHLDDFTINFSSKKARLFASRGQQKLIVFLFKVAQLQLLGEKAVSACFLLDDFLTDLDRSVFDRCLELLLKIDCQVFLTCPIRSYVDTGKAQIQIVGL